MEKHLSNAIERLIGNYELHVKQAAYQHLKLYLEHTELKLTKLTTENDFLRNQIKDLKTELTALQFVPEKASKGKKDG